MKEITQQNLPKSRKALEYRVFWLERKLSFLHASDKRKLTTQKIEKMPASPIKELMHLNNEFQRANDQAHALKDLTEELNQDALRINERSEHMNEITASKINDAERLNRQSKRLHDRGRVATKEAMCTTAVAREINNESKTLNLAAKAHIEESRYLSDLSRAQHQATDQLNQKTRVHNVDAMKTTATSIQLNRVLSDTHKESVETNAKAREISIELDATKLALAKVIAESEAINQESVAQQKTMAGLEQSCKQTLTDVADITASSRAQFKQNQNIIALTESINTRSVEKISELADKSLEIKNNLEENQKTQDELAEKLSRDMALLELDTVSKIKGFTNAQAASNHELLNELSHQTSAKVESSLHKLEAVSLEIIGETQSILDKCASETSQLQKQVRSDCQQQLAHVVTQSTKITDEVVEDFQQRADTSLSKSEDTIDLLADRIVQNLDQSQSFIEDTAALNDETFKMAKETTTLNAISGDLHQQCEKAIDEIDVALSEIERVKTSLNDETKHLQYQSEELNAESKLLIRTGSELNNQSLSVQKESMKTQELSQEINSHSLALHQEIRIINQDFDNINESNRSLVEKLTSLKVQLLKQYELNQIQVNDADKTNMAGIALNEDTSTLNSETRLLNQQTFETLKSAKNAIAESENLNKTSVLLGQDIRESKQQLENLKNRLEQAEHATLDAAAEARQTIETSVQMHQTLVTSVDEVNTLKEQANSEMSALTKIKDEAKKISSESKTAQLSLKSCIEESRQINDEFMRGLEVTGKAHAETKASAETLQQETALLHLEIKDMLSLKTGFKDFQENIDRCQIRLDEYADGLDTCQKSTFTHTELLTDYQYRIENYQTDLQRYRDSVSHFESRARRVESSFSDQDLRIKDLESAQDNGRDEILFEQIEKIRALEIEIRTDVKARENKLEKFSLSLKDEMQVMFTTMRKDNLQHINNEMETQQKRLDSKMVTSEKAISNIGNDVTALNQKIALEIRTLQEESLELRNKSREFQHQNKMIERDQVNKNDLVDHDLNELKHKLSNYQDQLQNQIDGDQDHELDHRLSTLEISIRNQQLMLEDHESFQITLAEEETHKRRDQKSVAELTEMVSNIGQTMEDAVTTNRTLKSAMLESERINKQLAKSNAQLQSQLKASITERDGTLETYASRLNELENKEGKYQRTISSLKSNETETKQTLQQMRMAMKDSTKAMRDTQKTLEKFRSKETVESKHWLENSKQAVLSSFFAVIFTGLAMLSFDKVDASTTVAVTTLAEQSSIIDQKIDIADSIDITDVIKGGLLSLNRASDSIDRLGEFAWPVNFGMVDPGAINYQPHRRGISISAELGDPVVAVNDGVVIYSANEIRGYGNVIVIKHDDDLVSVYANNQFNYVNEGDKVRRGQLIGDIGQLFNKEEAGLYFEIRYKGKPEDPFNYLNRSVQSNVANRG